MPDNSTAIPQSPQLSRRAFSRLAWLLATAGILAAPTSVVGQNDPTESRSGQFDDRSSDDGTRADDAEPADVPAAGKTRLHRLLDESAGRYKLYAGDDRAEPLKLKCVLRWANVTRGSVDGATYIWTKNGRPLATVCVYPWAGLLCDNFQSLAEGEITAYADGGQVWRCEQPGVTFRAVPGAPRPDNSAAARLRQIRSLGGRFRTTLRGWNADNSDQEELRMLPRPVYQHESAGLIEGAIFAFVQGTDPEAFLLLQARPKLTDADRSLEWQFALARRTSGQLETRYDGEVVWKAERLRDYTDPTKPHFQKTRRFLIEADNDSDSPR